MDESLLIFIVCCVSVSSSLIAALVWWWIAHKKKKNSSKTPRSAPTTTTTTTTATTISNGEGGKTNITFYGQTAGDDNRLGLTGMDLDAHGKAGLTLNGKPVYAGAVHQFAGPKYLYKVLEVQGGGVTPLYIHVVDICDEKDSVCNKNVKANGNNFLVDIFQTGFKAAGKSDGLLSGTYKVVGDIPASKIPKNVWKEDYILSKCVGKCADGKDRKWVKASSLYQ